VSGRPSAKVRELSFPDFAARNDADVGAAKMFLCTICDRTLANLCHIVLRMHQGDLVLKKLSGPEYFAHLRDGNFWFCEQGSVACAVFTRGLPGQGKTAKSKL